MKKPTEDELGGLYFCGGQAGGLGNDLDDEAARLYLNLPPGSDHPLHGTYTRRSYHRVVARNGPAGEPADDADQFPNGVLDIFDEEGNFAHFEWNGWVRWGHGADEVGVWELHREPITVQGPDSLMPHKRGLVLDPSLSLARTTASERPRNGMIGEAPYPRPLPQEAAAPYQYLCFDDGGLSWVLPAVTLGETPAGTPPAETLKLKFTKYVPVPLRHDAKQAGLTAWSDLFANTLPQWEFPLLGWDVRRLDIYADRPVENTGTQGGVSQDGYVLHGKPLFRLPANQSADYTPFQSTEDKKVYLPLGTVADYRPAGMQSSHTLTMSALVDRTSAWSLTVGLSAGIEKVFSLETSVGYKQKLEKQQQSETRYTLARQLTTEWVVLTDVVNLQLDPDFQNAIFRTLTRLDSGDGPQWEDFVNEFGTHYVNALTYGVDTLIETEYSLEAEKTAWERGLDIKLHAAGTLKALTLKGKADTSFSWGGELGNTVTQESVLERSVGSHSAPAAVFLDLRPIWELFSPIFFPPLFEFADPKHADAPFVWRLLRPSLRNYLKKTVHLNEPLDDSYYRDFTPYIVEVQPELKFHLPNTKPRNLDINCRFTADPGVVMLDTPANKPPANILPPFLSVNADGSTSVPYRPTATFVAAAGTGAGKGGVLEIWTRDTDHYLESRWTFPFTLDGTSGFIQPSSSTGGGVPAIRITLEVKFGVVAHSRPGVRRRP